MLIHNIMCTLINVASMAEAGMQWAQLVSDRPGDENWCGMLDGQILCSQTQAQISNMLGVLQEKC